MASPHTDGNEVRGPTPKEVVDAAKVAKEIADLNDLNKSLNALDKGDITAIAPAGNSIFEKMKFVPAPHMPQWRSRVDKIEQDRKGSPENKQSGKSDQNKESEIRSLRTEPEVKAKPTPYDPSKVDKIRDLSLPPEKPRTP